MSGALGPAANPLRVGARVVLRHRRAAGSVPPLTDAVGTVIALDDAGVTLETTRGPVTIARRDFVAARAVPPRQTRPGPAHTTIGVDDLELVMAQGWSAVERDGLGEWVLRASSGFTGRGNSVLPIGDPTLSLPAAVDYVERWYAARELPPRFHLDLPAGSSDPGRAADDPLGAELLSRGYRAVQPTLTMTAASAGIPALDADAAPVTMDARLQLDWLQTYARQRTILPGVTEQLLTGSPSQLFASMGTSAQYTAIGRMSVQPGWAGVHALWVDPDHRRQGLGATVVRAMAALAREHRMPSMMLQVEDDNVAAVALYAGLGFTTHHAYVYLDAPS
ncbi:MAG: GNAT family N-acetyltransferase [Lapillicoccus sp.]